MPKRKPDEHFVEPIKNLKRSEWDAFVKLLERIFSMEGTSAEKRKRILAAVERRNAELEFGDLITLFDGTTDEVI